ncbi:MAG: cyclic nucleotide-binding domain-containing protein [Alphaproteobacteria bacterium]|nr:cyclic nucleotide-binding domain-containing protein [Alphaproteobacteria bacterium]
MTAQESRGRKGGAWSQFLSGLRRKTLGDGQLLFREGEHGDEMYIILSGRVILHRLTDAADELCLAMLGPGQVVGELALFTPGSRTATATVRGRTVVARLNRRELLERMVRKDPAARELLRGTTRVVVRRLRHTRDLTRILEAHLEGAPDREIDRRLARLMTAHEGRVLRNNLRGSGPR